MRVVQAGPLHSQLGGGGGSHAPLPVQLRDGGRGGAGEIFVLGDCGQVLSQARLNTFDTSDLTLET